MDVQTLICLQEISRYLVSNAFMPATPRLRSAAYVTDINKTSRPESVVS